MRPTIGQFKKWRAERRADFLLPRDANVRTAKCRLCGRALAAGQGRGYTELMADMYRGSVRYVCSGCEESTRV